MYIINCDVERIQDSTVSALPPVTSEALKALHNDRLKVLESDNYFSVRSNAVEETFELEDDESRCLGMCVVDSDCCVSCCGWY